MTDQTSTYAIFTDDHGQRDRFEYVADASDEVAALQVMADDLFSGDHSVEAGWDWHIFEVPADAHKWDADDADKWVRDQCGTVVNTDDLNREVA